MLKVILDAILIAVSFILGYWLRFKVLVSLTAPGSLPVLEEYLNVLVVVTLIWLAIFRLVGLYEEKKLLSLIDELAKLFWGISLAVLVLLGLLFLNRDLWFSRLVIVNVWWLSFLFMGLMRCLIFFFKRFSRSRGFGVKKTLLLGAGEMGQLLAQKISQDKTLGYQPVGFLDDDPGKLGQTFFGLTVLGPVSRIKQIIADCKVEEVVIASSKFPAQKVLEIITECERSGLEFKLVPGILELIASRVDIDELAGVPLLTVSEVSLRGLNAAIKRGADIIFSALGLLLLSPFFILFAALVKLTSPGPVFFGQERIGQDGKIFKMFKFRSMIQNAEKLFPQLAPLSEVEGNLFKIKDDPRITPLGRFMRRYSIDEYPQLLNVLFGQMSLVGPRPPLPREVKNYSSWHKKRLRVRPGITGPWQVSGRSLLPFDDMVRLDIYYIENWSLWLDLKILLRTIPVVLFGTGAY